jgi:hypothetical protein
MSATPKLTFDVYRKRTNPTLRIAITSSAALPRQFPSKDWTLMNEASQMRPKTSPE